MADQNNNAGIEILLQTLNENPKLWETRKKTAELLYAEKEYMRAADILWNAPEIPGTDLDVAFVLKIISRVRPSRAIRLIYEIVNRNQSSPHKNIAVAKALNDAGMYLEAARFYGAALANDSSLFDLGFERQMLWLDDSGKLREEWKHSDPDSRPPLDVSEQFITGGAIAPDTLTQDPHEAIEENGEKQHESNIIEESLTKPTHTPTHTPANTPADLDSKTPMEQPLQFAPLDPNQLQDST